MKLHFKNNVIHFTLTNKLSLKKSTKAKKDDAKNKTSEKWNYCGSILLWYLLSTYHFITLWYMTNKTVMNENEIKKIINSKSDIC